MQNSEYGPSIVRTGTGIPRGVFAGNSVPSGSARSVTAFPRRRFTASSTPENTAHGHASGRACTVVSMRTFVRCFPAFFSTSRVRKK